MVNGLAHFLKHFDGFEDYFILIGGTACDLWMGKRGLEFRATKDLDIVLVAESLTVDFFERFWDFIREGNYTSQQKSEPRPRFYRFQKPSHPEHPQMIELFTRNYLDVPDDCHLTPVPSGEDVSSLSAILLGDDYYEFVSGSRIVIDGVPTIPVQCLIPLKARAFLDLIERKANGANVDSSHIKKHRNDVFRLYLTLAPADRFNLPGQLRGDLGQFLNELPADSNEWNGIRDAVDNLPDPAQIIDQLRQNFEIGLDRD